MKTIHAAILAFGLYALASMAMADPVRLPPGPKPVITIKSVSTEDVQNAILSLMLPAGKTPVRQDPNVMVFEFPLGFGQSLAVQMVQGNSGWQQPKGRQTFTMAKIGPDVMVAGTFETVATNMFNAENRIEINNTHVHNEMYLGLQMIAAIAEKRVTAGQHNALGITAYEKPSRKTKKIGYVIQGVVPGGPADVAGLAAGDIVTHIGGVSLAEQNETTVSMLGFLQPTIAELDVQAKGRVTLVKNSAWGGMPGVAGTVTPNAAVAAPAASETPVHMPASITVPVE